jgi:serine/threonine protein phosphatase PrpC
VALPDINYFKLIDNYHDFILIASDGVFDKMTTEETLAIAWQL